MLTKKMIWFLNTFQAHCNTLPGNRRQPESALRPQRALMSKWLSGVRTGSPQEDPQLQVLMGQPSPRSAVTAGPLPRERTTERLEENEVNKHPREKPKELEKEAPEAPETPDPEMERSEASARE